MNIEGMSLHESKFAEGSYDKMSSSRRRAWRIPWVMKAYVGPSTPT